jgi:cell division topological specificity factor
VALLRGEILAVICRHIMVDPEKVQVKMDRGGVVSTLAIEVEIPA